MLDIISFNCLIVRSKKPVIYNKNKKTSYMGSFFVVSTQEEIRTPTPIRAPAPQAGASTNFATWVCGCKYNGMIEF